MKYLKLFESFDRDNVDLLTYAEDFWNVDPEHLRDFFRSELEDNSLVKMDFIMEKEDKKNYSFLEMTKTLKAIGILSSIEFKSGNRFEPMYNFFNTLVKVEEKKAYPVFNSGRVIIDSSIYTSSVYYKNKSGIFMPEIILYFDKDSALQDGNIGEWEEKINDLFEKTVIPYSFDGDGSWYESDKVCYVLYHT